MSHRISFKHYKHDEYHYLVEQKPWLGEHPMFPQLVGGAALNPPHLSTSAHCAPALTSISYQQSCEENSIKVTINSQKTGALLFRLNRWLYWNPWLPQEQNQLWQIAAKTWLCILLFFTQIICVHWAAGKGAWAIFIQRKVTTPAKQKDPSMTRMQWPSLSSSSLQNDSRRAGRWCFLSPLALHLFNYFNLVFVRLPWCLLDRSIQE